MKLLLISLSALYVGLLLPKANAEINLAEPSTLIQKANKSRIACREVILDITQNIPEMRDPVTFEKYFALLNPLKSIADKNRLDEIFPDAVESLGLLMVSSGIRWLSISKDSPEKILEYHKWMNVDVAFDFQSSIDFSSTTIKDPLELQRLANNTEVLIHFSDTNFPQNLELRNGYRKIVSELAARSLRDESISEEVRLFWLAKIYTSSAFSSVIDTIHQNALSLSLETKTKSHVYVRRLLLVANKMKNDGIEIPQWINNQISEVSLEIILKNIDLTELFESNEFSILLNLLTTRSLQSLAQQWTNLDRIPRDTYVEHYLILTRTLIVFLRANQLEAEANNVKKFEERLAAPIVGGSKQIEGTYVLKDPKGKKWIFTAVLANKALLYVELADANGFVNKAYFNVTYGVEDDTFVASEREVDLEPTHNFTMRFKLLGNGLIEVRDLMASPEIQNLNGKKIESYPNYFPQSSQEPIDPSGTYKGFVSFSSNFGTELSVIVTGFNGYSLGRASDAMGAIVLDLNMGTRGTDGVLYLTSGRIRNSHWIQFRGVIQDGNFIGYTIVGGKGISKRAFKLKKVLN